MLPVTCGVKGSGETRGIGRSSFVRWNFFVGTSHLRALKRALGWVRPPSHVTWSAATTEEETLGSSAHLPRRASVWRCHLELGWPRSDPSAPLSAPPLLLSPPPFVQTLRPIIFCLIQEAIFAPVLGLYCRSQLPPVLPTAACRETPSWSLPGHRRDTPWGDGCDAPASGTMRIWVGESRRTVGKGSGLRFQSSRIS